MSVRAFRSILNAAGIAFYTFALITVMVAAFALHMRENGIFSCPADRYGGDHYLGLCDSSAYGDFDHGAFWFGLEPEAIAAARNAEVLFLGNSKLQFGLSSPALGLWFSERDASYYLLGFSHDENVEFASPLLQRMRPRARVYVINAEGFFTDRQTAPAAAVMTDQDGLNRYRGKQAWQPLHRWLCGRWPALCGNRAAFYRQRETGAWIFTGSFGEGLEKPVGPEAPPDLEKVAQMRAHVGDFFNQLGVERECVILTALPYQYDERRTMERFAAEEGMAFIAPQLTTLRTFDGYHLDRGSAQLFTTAFFQQAGPRISRCLGLGGEGEQAP